MEWGFDEWLWENDDGKLACCITLNEFRIILEDGKMGECMERDSMNGKMEESLKDSTKTI